MHNCSIGLNIVSFTFNAELAEHVNPARQDPTHKTLALPKPDILVKAPSADVSSHRRAFQVHPVLLAACAIRLAASLNTSITIRRRHSTQLVKLPAVLTYHALGCPEVTLIMDVRGL